MRTHKLLICFAMISLGILACVDTIDIELPLAEGGRLVIEGSVERGPDEYLIRASVRRTAQRVQEIVLELETADIFLLLNEEEVLELPNNEEVRMSIDSFHNQLGATPTTARFRIRAVLPNGQVYESEDQQVLNPPSGGKLEINLLEREELNSAGILFQEEYVELFVSTPLQNDQAEQLSLLWEVSGMFEFREVAWTNDPGFFPAICYVPVEASPDEISVISATDASGPFLSQFKLTEIEANSRFQSGYYFTVLQKALDIQAAEYWKQVAASIRREGTIFDPPPGRVISNIRNPRNPSDEVLGYFFAAGIDTLRYLATPEETGEQLHTCVVEPRHPVCCDCLETFFYGSTNKPHYWD